MAYRYSLTLQEFYGPNLWSLYPGWLVGARGDGLKEPPRIRFGQEWNTWINQFLDALKPLDYSNPLEISITIAEGMISPWALQPVQLHQPGLEFKDTHRFVRCPAHDLAGEALRLALRVVRLGMQVNSPSDCADAQSLKSAIQSVSQRAKALRSDAFTNAVIDEATQRGLPFWILDEKLWNPPILQIGTGSRSRLICSTCVDKDSFIGGTICSDKALTNQLLKRIGYSVPRQMILPKECTHLQVLSASRSIGFPCVLKPRDASQGHGVTARIMDQSSLLDALPKAEAAARAGLVLEQHVPGDIHRLVVLNGRLVRVRLFRQPHLIADGQRTIRTMLEEAQNEEPKTVGVFCYGTTPPLDEKMLQLLQVQGLHWGSIPAEGCRVDLRYDLIDRDDWVDIDLLEKVHPSLIHMAEELTKAVGMNNLGIDVLSQDITRPVYEQQLWINEMNPLQLLHPSAAGMMLWPMFPDQTSSRIEISVEVFTSERDLPSLKSLTNHLTDSQDTTLAIPRRLINLFGHSYLNCLTEKRPIIIYDHPREALFNRSARALLFLISWEELTNSGLPTSQIDHLHLLGQLPTKEMAEYWENLVQTLLPRMEMEACCPLPITGST